MCRSRPDRHRHFAFLTLPVLFLAGAGTSPAVAQAAVPSDHAQDQAPTGEASVTSLLDVRMNGWTTGVVGRFRAEGGRLLVHADQFEAIGFRASARPAATAGGDPLWIDLGALPGVRWTIDAHAQAIDITAPAALLPEASYRVSPRAGRVDSRSDWGAMLSYDLYGQWSPDTGDSLFARTFSANLDARLFSPHFTASSSGLLTVGGGRNQYVRLDSSIVFDDPGGTQSLRLGDSYTAGPSWVRPIRFGGIQWARNFSLRPDIVTSPVATLSRDVAVPSTVDLFINGVRSYSQAVNPGTIRLDDLPVPTGANTVDMVVTDQAGRRTEVSLPFYSSSQLLAAGMTDFDVEAGFPRLNYSVASNDYGHFFASGSLSRGITDRLTLRGYAAATHGYGGGAAGATVRLGALGVVDSALLMSGGTAGTGIGYYVGMEHVSRLFSLAGSYTHAGGNYQDLASRFGGNDFVDRATGSMSVGLGRAGNINLAYVWSHAHDQSVSSIVSATYGVNVHHGDLYLTTSGYADTRDKGWGVLLSASVHINRRTQAYTQQSWRDGERTSSIQINGESPDQRLNWQVEGSQGGTDEITAQANWRGPGAGLYGRVAHVDGSTGVQAELMQSLIFMDKQLFLSRLVDDGFTVVDVPDEKGVTVSLENHPIGKTDANGRILVPGLQPYVGNRVSINPLDLPANADIKETVKLVSPRAGGGMITKFDVTRQHAALVTLLRPDGTPPPVGAAVFLGDGPQASVLGFDGQVYLRNVAPGGNRVQVKWPGGTCAVTFSIDSARQALPRVGPLTCAP